MSFFEVNDRPIQVSVFGRTDRGRQRSENQDSFLVVDLSGDVENGGFRLDSKELTRSQRSGEFALGRKGSLLIVADGMGGAAAGGVASELATTYIHEALVATWLPDRSFAPEQFALRLREAVEETNVRIHERSKQHPDLHGMGTTSTAMGILDSFLYVAQVGDSRAYLIRRGEARQLTKDQSMVQQMVNAGMMTEEQAELSRQRNVILQALGIGEEVQVDLTYQELRRGDIAILCSDGLSGQVRREEIAEAVDRTPDLVAVCEQLVDMANTRGGPDNITVVAARFDGEGLQDPSPDDAVGHRVYAGPSF